MHAGLAELLTGNDKSAHQHFTEIIMRGVYSPDPAEQDLANFFVKTASRGVETKVIAPDSVRDLDLTQYDALQLFIAAVKNWTLGATDEAGLLFRQFLAGTPQDRYAWIAEYKPLASPYIVEINAFRAASETAQAATSLETRQRALQLVKDTRTQLRLSSPFPAHLDKLAGDLQQKITAEQQEAEQRMSATEAADAKSLADAQAKITPLWQQFRLVEAFAVAKAVTVSGEKGQREQTALLKRMEWLARFKVTLVNDLNLLGYPSAVTRKNGGQIPGPVRRANESQIETVTPFGTLPALWTDLAPESVLAMGKSFLRPELSATVLADRQWLLGVYAMQAGRQREGRDLLIQASQTKESYREELSLFIESANAP